MPHYLGCVHTQSFDNSTRFNYQQCILTSSLASRHRPSRSMPRARLHNARLNTGRRPPCSYPSSFLVIFSRWWNYSRCPLLALGLHVVLFFPVTSFPRFITSIGSRYYLPHLPLLISSIRWHLVDFHPFFNILSISSSFPSGSRFHPHRILSAVVLVRRCRPCIYSTGTKVTD